MIRIATLGSRNFDLPPEQAVWLANHWANRLLPDDRSAMLGLLGRDASTQTPISDARSAELFFLALTAGYPLLVLDVARTAHSMAAGTYPETQVAAAALYVSQAATPSLASTDTRRIGAENLTRLHDWFGIDMLGSHGLGTDIRLALPDLFEDAQTARRWMSGTFPGAAYRLSGEKTADGRYVATMGLRSLMRQLDAAHHPFGTRALEAFDDETRQALLQESAYVLGKPIPGDDSFAPPEETLSPKEVKQRRDGHKALDVTQLMRAGMLHLDVRNEESILYKAALYARKHAVIGPNDLAFAMGRKGTHPDITLSRLGFFTLCQLMERGFPDPTAASATPPLLRVMDASLQEERYARLVRQRVAETGARMEALAQENSGIPEAAMLHPAAMLAALQGIAPLVADEHNWKALAAAEPYAKVNPVRDRLRATVADLNALLPSRNWNQKQLKWLVRDSQYADAIHTLGRFAEIVYAEGGKKADPRVDAYLSAFGLTRLSLQPKDEAARDALYYAQKSLKQIGFVDQVKHVGLLGVRSLWDSVKFAADKPLQVGGTLIAIAGVSTLLPSKYRPYSLLISAVEKGLSSVGLNHEHKEKLIDGVKSLKQGMQDLRKGIGSHKGYLAVSVLTAATLGAAFLVFSVVEDFVLHVPLAVASMGVGFAGAALGVNVFKPFWNEIANITGSFLPKSVQRSLAHDGQALRNISVESSLKDAAKDIREGYRDVSELGALAALSDPIPPRFAERIAILRDQAARSVPGNRDAASTLPVSQR